MQALLDGSCSALGFQNDEDLSLRLGYLAGDIDTNLLGLHQMLPTGTPFVNSEILCVHLR